MAGYTKMDALQALVGGQITVYSDGTDPIYHDGQTPPSDAEIDAKITELKADYDALDWKRSREKNYPSVGDQLDMLMKDMRDRTETHQEACEAVKAKYPK